MGWLTFSMQAGFFLGPSIAGIALRWIDVRTDIAVTTVLVVFAIPGALAASGTRQHTGQGLSLRAPLQALVSQAAFLPVTIGLIATTLVWGTIGAFLPVFGKEALGLPSAEVGYQVYPLIDTETSTEPVPVYRGSPAPEPAARNRRRMMVLLVIAAAAAVALYLVNRSQ